MLYVDKIGMIGGIYSTIGISELIKEKPILNNFVSKSINMFFKCKWGNICQEDVEANKEALQTGARLMGVYKNENLKIWIIADATDDNNVRTAVTVLLPEEY